MLFWCEHAVSLLGFSIHSQFWLHSCWQENGAILQTTLLKLCCKTQSMTHTSSTLQTIESNSLVYEIMQTSLHSWTLPFLSHLNWPNKCATNLHSIQIKAWTWSVIRAAKINDYNEIQQHYMRFIGSSCFFQLPKSKFSSWVNCNRAFTELLIHLQTTTTSDEYRPDDSRHGKVRAHCIN